MICLHLLTMCGLLISVFTLALPWDIGPSQTQMTTELESVNPRSFAEANARSNRGVIEVIDAESDFQRGCSELRSFLGSNNRRRRGPPTHTSVYSDCCINLENNEKTKGKNVAEVPGMSQSVPPPKAPGFSCPICMGPFVEETSTKCGHIFCKMCIYVAIAAQNKCPTCRQKIKVRHHQDLPSLQCLKEAHILWCQILWYGLLFLGCYWWEVNYWA